MDINLETLHEEKRGLQADFEKLGGNIKQVEVDLAQMKANLNAINGAIQQVNKLIGMTGDKVSSETKENVKKV